MTVKVLIRRKIKDSAMKEASKMLIQARTNAVGNPGYISSETLCLTNNPQEVVIISTWRNNMDWYNYTQKPSRIDLEREFEQLFEEPTEYKVYDLGFHPELK